MILNLSLFFILFLIVTRLFYLLFFNLLENILAILLEYTHSTWKWGTKHFCMVSNPQSILDLQNNKIIRERGEWRLWDKWGETTIFAVLIIWRSDNSKLWYQSGRKCTPCKRTYENRMPMQQKVAEYIKQPKNPRNSQDWFKKEIKII